jgi:hypothetical protein
MSFSSIKELVEFIRDIGLILGIPGIIFLGYKLFDRHIIALKDAHKAHIDALESENRLLKETQYDRALKLIEAEKKLFQHEREKFEDEIAKLKLEKETQEQVTKVNTLISDSRDIAMEELAKTLRNKKLSHLDAEAWEDFLDMKIFDAFNINSIKGSKKD